LHKGLGQEATGVRQGTFAPRGVQHLQGKLKLLAGFVQLALPDEDIAACEDRMGLPEAEAVLVADRVFLGDDLPHRLVEPTVLVEAPAKVMGHGEAEGMPQSAGELDHVLGELQGAIGKTYFPENQSEVTLV
jgi:hypothetical protein